MRTHFLSKLPLPGKEIALDAFPDFDFYNLRQIVRLTVTGGTAGSSAEVILLVLYNDPVGGRRALVTLRFSGVCEAQLPMFSPCCFLDEFEIEDIRTSQLEGITYKSKCYGLTQFEVLSHDLLIDGCEVLE